jgi:hypothetical protein
MVKIASPWRRSQCRRRFLALAVVEQQGADEDQADRPDPGDGAAGAVGEAELEPARPADGDAEDGDRDVAELGQQLVLGVVQGVAVGEQEGAAEEADEGEDEGGGRRGGTVGLHAALEEGEGDDEQHRQPVLQRLGDQEAAPEGHRTERPVLGGQLRAQRQPERTASRPASSTTSRPSGRRLGSKR